MYIIYRYMSRYIDICGCGLKEQITLLCVKKQQLRI